MIDFSGMIGKKVAWAGNDTNEDGEITSYVLFEDCACYSIDSSGHSELLKDGIDTLEQVVRSNLQKATSIMKLAAVLKEMNTPKPRALPETKERSVEAVPGDSPKF